ncbi:MAG: 2Fe-2S iron-sulfur cluster binding domain-containing protein [Granulosicoccus sp.]|nr:2Fe-2S iron-sulfur cluster binding domain-containing protein [Granulosicoccus sp.]
MVQFHDLQVIDVQRTTRDSVAVTLEPIDQVDFSFIQGQYLTFRREFNGTELRRSYSICAARNNEQLRVGIKKVAGGAFSTWANERLRTGDILQAMKPMGNFHTVIDPSIAKRYLCIAGGSGITPVLSILKTVLIEEPLSQCSLIYANRNINSIMFKEELEDLKNRFMSRFSITHILESGSEEIELFSGLIDIEKCKHLFTHWLNVRLFDTAFICGPEPMMLTIAQSLKQHGMNEDDIKFELFSSSQPGKLKRSAASAQSGSTIVDKTKLEVTLDGSFYSISMDKNTTLLDALLDNAIDAPFACRAGVCSTCRCRIIEGETEMAANHALEDYEVERGYTLACQTYPLSDHLVIAYEH